MFSFVWQVAEGLFGVVFLFLFSLSLSVPVMYLAQGKGGKRNYFSGCIVSIIYCIAKSGLPVGSFTMLLLHFIEYSGCLVL